MQASAPQVEVAPRPRLLLSKTELVVVAEQQAKARELDMNTE